MWKRMMRLYSVMSGLLLICLGPQPAWGATYAIDQSKSVFGIVTHKGGYAASLAHNHFICANSYDATLIFDAENLPNSGLIFSVPVTGLVADQPEVSAAWSPRINALKLLAEPLPTVSESDRHKIYKDMVSPTQLDIERFPVIQLTVKNLQKKETVVGSETFQYQMTVALTVRGQTVEKVLPVHIKVEGDILQAESIGKFSFTEFGITPFSALMGAVKNLDEFDAYVNVTAKAI